MTKVDDEDHGLSRCRCLGNLVRPDLAAKDVALFRLCMHPVGGHLIIRLPGFLPDETSIPETPLPSISLLPTLSYLDVGNRGQDAHSILCWPWPILTCVSRLPHHGQSKRSKEQQTHNSDDAYQQKRHGSSPSAKNEIKTREERVACIDFPSHSRIMSIYQ